jgi:hypothetical protein
MEEILGLAILPHPGKTTRNELLKAQMRSGALCKMRQNLGLRITFVPSSFLEWFIDGFTEDFHESLVHMFCHYSLYTTVLLEEKSIPMVSCEEACFERRK